MISLYFLRDVRIVSITLHFHGGHHLSSKVEKTANKHPLVTAARDNNYLIRTAGRGHDCTSKEHSRLDIFIARRIMKRTKAEKIRLDSSK